MSEPSHRPIMVEEVVRCLHPRPGDAAIDCTLGGGGHARAILEQLRLRQGCGGTDVQHDGRVLGAADIVLADLGISSMQADNPARGFNFKLPGPLDMRMDPSRGEPASQFLARVDGTMLATVLEAHADEPHAARIATLLKRDTPATSHALERTVRLGLAEAFPNMTKAEIKKSVRRTFQALRIAVNDELTALDALLRWLPGCLAPGGRVAILTFHSGEDRRVKKAFQTGHRTGVYAEIAQRVIRSAKSETFSNRRAAAAKLRWAVRAVEGSRGAQVPGCPGSVPGSA
jgi:16S rRNA (cytosine1402-N4)-methyltransferase